MISILFQTLSNHDDQEMSDLRFFPQPLSSGKLSARERAIVASEKIFRAVFPPHTRPKLTNTDQSVKNIWLFWFLSSSTKSDQHWKKRYFLCSRSRFLIVCIHWSQPIFLGNKYFEIIFWEEKNPKLLQSWPLSHTLWLEDTSWCWCRHVNTIQGPTVMVALSLHH